MYIAGKKQITNKKDANDLTHRNMNNIFAIDGDIANEISVPGWFSSTRLSSFIVPTSIS